MRKRWLGVGLLVAMAAVAGVPRLPDGLSPPADRPAVDQAEADRVTLDVNELIARAAGEGPVHEAPAGGAGTVRVCIREEADGRRKAVVDLTEAPWVVPAVDPYALTELGLDSVVEFILWKAEGASGRLGRPAPPLRPGGVAGSAASRHPRGWAYPSAGGLPPSGSSGSPCAG